MTRSEVRYHLAILRAYVASTSQLPSQSDYLRYCHELHVPPMSRGVMRQLGGFRLLLQLAEYEAARKRNQPTPVPAQQQPRRRSRPSPFATGEDSAEPKTVA